MSAPLADAHLHLFRRGFPASRGGPRPVLGAVAEIEAYEALRRVHGIALGLAIGYEAGGIDPDNNAYLRQLAAERPWLETLAYVDPHSAPEAAALARLLDAGHTGLAIYLPGPDAGAALTAWGAKAWDVLEQRAAVVSLNAAPAQIGALGTLVAARQGCRFLFSHLGLPGRCSAEPSSRDAAERLQPLTDLSPLRNASVKISGLYAVSEPPHAYPHAAAAPFVRLLLDRFGPERCLWGSDFSPALEFVSFAQTASIPWLDELGRAEREAVMGANLLTLLRREGAYS